MAKIKLIFIKSHLITFNHYFYYNICLINPWLRELRRSVSQENMELDMVLLLEKLSRNFSCNKELNISVPRAEKYFIFLFQSSVKRVACGIWKCRACKVTFAGGAFEFATSVATTAKVTMNRLKKLK